MGRHVEDHSTNHRGWARGYRLRGNLTWWIKLVLSFACTICGCSARPPHLGNLSYIHSRGQAENQTGTSYISTKWLWQQCIHDKLANLIVISSLFITWSIFSKLSPMNKTLLTHSWEWGMVCLFSGCKVCDRWSLCVYSCGILCGIML